MNKEKYYIFNMGDLFKHQSLWPILAICLGISFIVGFFTYIWKLIREVNYDDRL